MQMDSSVEQQLSFNGASTGPIDDALAAYDTLLKQFGDVVPEPGQSAVANSVGNSVGDKVAKVVLDTTQSTIDTVEQVVSGATDFVHPGQRQAATARPVDRDIKGRGKVIGDATMDNPFAEVPSTAALSEDGNDYIAALKDDKASLGFTSAVLLLTGVSILLTWILNKLDPKASVVYNGFRRTKYTASLAWQLIVLPVCIGFMFSWSAPSSLPQFLEWAQRGRLQFKAAPCYFFAALTATQLKDFITEFDELWRSQKMFWHHVVVVVTCVYAEWLPEGYGNFALVCFALELGSACFNLCSIFPWSRLAWCLYHCSFATSHMIALCGLWLMFSYDQVHMFVRLIFAMSGIGVIIGRQVVSIIKWRKGFDDHLQHIHDTHDEDVKHKQPEDKTI